MTRAKRAKHAPESPPQAKPIIKWAGGKTELLPELLKRAPRSFRTYHEPFFGGGALFWALAPERAVVSDINSDLIGMYRAVALRPQQVRRRLDHHRDQHDITYYGLVRAEWNQRAWDPPRVDHRVDHAADHAAAFIYLNKACFNGIWRVNRAGQMNTPCGDKKPALPSLDQLRAASMALRKSEIVRGHFLEVSSRARRGDFVYFDPPYDGTFTQYTKDGFTGDDQLVLANFAWGLAARGVKVMVSNADTKRVRRLYNGVRIDTVKCRRAINADGDGRGPVNELIITLGYDCEAQGRGAK